MNLKTVLNIYTNISINQSLHIVSVVSVIAVLVRQNIKKECSVLNLINQTWFSEHNVYSD